MYVVISNADPEDIRILDYNHLLKFMELYIKDADTANFKYAINFFDNDYSVIDINKSINTYAVGVNKNNLLRMYADVLHVKRELANKIANKYINRDIGTIIGSFLDSPSGPKKSKKISKKKSPR